MLVLHWDLALDSYDFQLFDFNSFIRRLYDTYTYIPIYTYTTINILSIWIDRQECSGMTTGISTLQLCMYLGVCT